MARNRSRRRKSPLFGDAVKGTVLGILGLILLVMLGCTYYYAATRADLFAACSEGKPTAIHAILIDHSDTITGQQAQLIRQAISRVKEKAVIGSRVDIFTFTGNTTDALPSVLSACVPERPENADPMFENKKVLSKDFDENFSAAVDQTVTHLLSQEPQQNSPIIESIRAAAQTSFGSTEEGDVPLRLTLVSDMIQHSPAVSHYREEPDFERLSKLPIWPSLRPRLKGATVDILYILRPSAMRGKVVVQSRGHQHFWEQLIAASGGVLDSVETP